MTMPTERIVVSYDQTTGARIDLVEHYSPCYYVERRVDGRAQAWATGFFATPALVADWMTFERRVGSVERAR